MSNLPSHIYEILLNRGLTDEEISTLTKEQVFAEVLTWKLGHSGWKDEINGVISSLGGTIVWS